MIGNVPVPNVTSGNKHCVFVEVDAAAYQSKYSDEMGFSASFYRQRAHQHWRAEMQFVYEATQALSKVKLTQCSFPLSKGTKVKLATGAFFMHLW